MTGLRIATYNIHQCVGADGRRDPARVAAVLRELDADVVGLQEVEVRTGLRTGSMQMQVLAAAVGLHAIAGPTIEHATGHYGNALLSRRPLRQARHIDLTVYRREPRAAIDAELDLSGATVRIIVTHLGLLPGERRIQVRRLLDAFGSPAPTTTILCGDINEWFAVGRPLRWLHARLGRTASVATFPSALPLFALDRIWVHPGGAHLELRAHATETARVASDHLPLVADIQVPSP